MISTRVMDMKLREAAEGLGEDGTGKKKSKFKTFKKLFGKKKRKESPASTGNSTWKQNPAKSEVIALDSGPVGYDSEDELEESRGTMGNRALSHDSIFIPESGQDPARPVRVFSQENVCDRIKALQLKIQCNVKMGPPPPGGLPVKRAEDTGMSSEDDGLPRSPPEMSLLHDVGSGTTIKISLVSSSRPQSPDHTSDATGSAQTLDGSLAPVADFSHPPEFSSCLDNSAAKHKLLVKPRNQRSSRLRRLSSRAQSELLSDMGYTLEEEEYEEKPFFQVSMDETSRSGKQDLMLGRQPEPGRPVILLPLAGARARRSRLQHSPALSASMEVGSFLGEEFSSRPVTPEVPEPLAVPVPCLEPPALQKSSPYHSPHGEIQKEKLSTKGPCPLVEVTSHEVVCTSGDMETPSSTCTLPRDTAPLNENADVPKGDAAPSNEDSVLPKGDLGLSNEDTALPKGDMAPSNEDAVLPKKEAAPSNEDAVLPKTEVAPSNEDSVLPKKEVAPSNEDSVLPKTEVAPSNEDSVLPKGDVAPSNEDAVLPKKEAAPSNEDSVLPKKDAVPSNEDSVLPKGDTVPSNEDAVLPKGDAVLPKGDVVPSKEDRVLLPKGDVIPSKEDRALAKGDVVPAKEATPSQGDKIPKENTTTEGDMVVFKGYTAPHKGDSFPSGTGTATAGKTTSDPHGRNQNVQTEEELTLVVPEPEGAGTVSPPGPARSSPVPKSCLKHKAPTLEVVPGGSPGPAAKASPLREPSPGASDREPTPPEHPKSAQAESPHAGPERAAPGRKSDRGGGAKKFSVSSSRARARAGSSRLLEHSGRVPAGGRMPLVRSGPAWRSEAALEDVQVPPGKADPPKPAEGEPRDSGASVASQAGLGRSPQDGAAEPGPGELCAPVQEPSPGEDRSPFPVKLRSTSLSLKYREGPGQEAKGIKRYSAEVRMEKGGPALIPKAEQGHGGAVPALRGAKSPNGQGKGKARSPEQPSAKPPLPRKPLLQSLTLPYPPAGLDVSPGEPEKAPAPPEPRKESRVPEKALHRGTEKGLPPAETAPGAEGKPTPPWITMTRQKRRGVPDLPPNQEDKPGSRILKTETGKQIKAPERPQESVKQADFVRSKSFLMTSVKPAMIQRQGSKLSLKEGLQRGISLSHQNLAQAAATTEKELHQLKRASYASADQPSWMELARKKSQAWSDMPQIIK